MRHAATVPPLDLTMDELHALLARLRPTVGDDEYQILEALVETFGYLTARLEDQTLTIEDLRQLLGRRTTEKTRRVLKGARGQTRPTRPAPAAPSPDGNAASEAPPAGHGRNGTAAYAGASQVVVSYGTLNAGDRCPECGKGKVYVAPPRRLVRIVGQAPLAATVYELEKLRCNLCGERFVADPPAGVGSEKYDASAASMIALLKYGNGLPFHRLATLQANLEIPLPASTQWEILAETATVLQPAFEELLAQAAQGEVLHNDDTSMRVLALRREIDETVKTASDRTGIFTSGIVATREDHRIALFFTGRQHAGENLTTVLAQRSPTAPVPIQMSDALARNVPKLPPPLAVIVANCLAHGRRQIVQVATRFPDACQHILETLGEVYGYDTDAARRHLSPEDRLRWHQNRSGPVLRALQEWMTAQFAKRHVEPNSSLGKAMRYLLRHWPKLTRFLEVAGAPIDNNVCERALKMAIRNRKNAYFYKTTHGAEVGDLFMSLIHTCELAGTNPFEYLTALQQHVSLVATSPSAWMPWNYQDAIPTPAPVEG
jgi:transposase